jgi:hypothetical protein
LGHCFGARGVTNGAKPAAPDAAGFGVSEGKGGRLGSFPNTPFDKNASFLKIPFLRLLFAFLIFAFCSDKEK